MPNFRLLLLLPIAFLTACAHDGGPFATHYRPDGDGKLRIKKTPIEQVKLHVCKDNDAEAKALRAMFKKGGYKLVGSSIIQGELVDPAYARELGAKYGGDLVVVAQYYLGKGTGSRMVEGGYIPGRTVQGTAHHRGTLSSGSTYSGTSDASVHIPSQTIYVRENYQYDNYQQSAFVMMSAKRLDELFAKGEIREVR